MTRLRVASALAAALLIVASGCAESSTTEPPAGTAPGVQIVLDRTGGNVGVHDHVVLNPDGSWSATDKSGAAKTGQLPAEQTAAIYKIVSSTEFAAEAATATSAPRCMDAPTVTITAGDKKITFMDCGTAETPPNASAVLKVFQDEILA